MIILFFIFFAIFLFFMPNLLGHTDNYIPANPMVTPTHIVPEWYFLPFYAILRSIPDKLLGVVVMVLSIVLLAALPFIIETEVKSLDFRPLSRYLFWFFVMDCLLLGWIGSRPAEFPYVEIGQFLTFFYFFFWLCLMPLIIEFEKYFWLQKKYVF